MQQSGRLSLCGFVCLTSLIVGALLSGCGGGGGNNGSGGSAGLIQSSGRVKMPPGSTLSLASLQAISADGTSAVKADGSFTVPERSTSPAIVQLTDATGNPIMLGFSSAAAGPGEISPRTTAEILLFYALGAEALPPDQLGQAFSLIEASDALTQLTSVVSARIAASPTVLTTGDTDLDTAVANAAESFVPPGKAVSVPAPSTRAVIAPPAAVARSQVVVTRRAPGRSAAGRAVGQLLIQPSGQQSGVEIIQNPNGDGIIASNNFRRRCQFFVYKTGTTDMNGNVNNLSLVQPVGGAHELPSVVKINGVFGTLTDLINNKVAYGPVNSDPVSLPLDPGTKETRYEIVVVGFSTNFLAPAVFSDPRYAQQAAALQAAYDDLSLDAFVREFLLNIVVTAVFAPNDIKSVLGDPTAISSLTIDLVKLVKSTPGVVDKLKAGKPVDAFAATATAIANSSGLRKQIITALAKLPTVARFGLDIPNGDKILGNLSKANTLLKGAELALSAGDIARLLSDWAAAHVAEVWSVKVEQPNVHLDPQMATVSVQNNIVKLTASVVGVQGPALRFVWSTTGTQGHLESANSSTPLGTGPIPDTQAAYVTDLLKLKNGQSDTVTVQAFLASDLNTPIGSATATISTGNDLGCGGLPKPFGPRGTFPPTLTLDKTDYHAGDTMTVTIGVPGVKGLQTWVVDMFNNDNRKPAFLDVLTLDGSPPPTGSVILNSNGLEVRGPINPNGAAETHVITFRVKTPKDLDGQPETQCAGGLTADGHLVGPDADAQLFGPDGFTGDLVIFFNAGP